MCYEDASPLTIGSQGTDKLLLRDDQHVHCPTGGQFLLEVKLRRLLDVGERRRET